MAVAPGAADRAALPGGDGPRRGGGSWLWSQQQWEAVIPYGHPGGGKEGGQWGRCDGVFGELPPSLGSLLAIGWGLWGFGASLGSLGAFCHHRGLWGSLSAIIEVFVGHYWGLWGLCWPSSGSLGISVGHHWGLWGFRASLGSLGTFCHHRGLWGSLSAIIGVFAGHYWGLCWPSLGSLGISVGHYWGLWGFRASLGCLGTFCHHWGLWGSFLAIIGVFGDLLPSLGPKWNEIPNISPTQKKDDDQKGTKS